MILCNWIREKEEYKEAYVKILKYSYDILDDDTANPRIHCLQDYLPPLKRVIAYLLYKIWIGFFAFYYHTHYSSEQK